MRRKMVLLLALTAGAVLGGGMQAAAKEFTTADSVMTIDAPDGWNEVEDESTWMTLGKGENRITLLHYRNGSNLPEMTEADETYVRVCQNILSTENEVFIITGSVTEEKDFEEVQKAVYSAKIKIYDTMTAVPKSLAGLASGKGNDSSQQKPSSGSSNSAAGSGTSGNTDAQGGGSKTDGQYQVEPMEATMWVHGEAVNVRSSYSTDAAVLGTIYFGDPIQATGVVKNGDTEVGWYRVDYNGVEGYASAQYLSLKATSDYGIGVTPTDEKVQLYKIDGYGANGINKATNGNWYDGSGRQFQSLGDGLWKQMTDGSLWTEEAPPTPADDAVDETQIVDAEGWNQQTLYLDGTTKLWENIAGGIYTPQDDGTWVGPDGAIWYSAQ